MSREKKQIDLLLLRGLARIHCTLKEMAPLLHCSVETLVESPEYQEIIEEGQQDGKMSLRRAMFRNAEDKLDSTMQKFLANHHLSMGDDVKMAQVEISFKTEELVNKVKAILRDKLD